MRCAVVGGCAGQAGEMMFGCHCDGYGPDRVACRRAGVQAMLLRIVCCSCWRVACRPGVMMFGHVNECHKPGPAGVAFEPHTRSPPRFCA